ncbi:MAG: hypothetical protein AABX47_10335 [Nanoarchaeota archaeon]
MISRKSTSDKTREEFASKRRKWLLTWFMAIIMVSSIFGFIMADQSGSQTNQDYKQFKVERTTTGYSINMDKTRTILTFDHPISAESVKVDPVVWDMLNKTKVMGVTYNQSDDRAEVFGEAQFLLEKDLFIAPRIYVQRGMFNASGTNLQSISCANADPAFPVMLLRIGDETRIWADGSCIMVQGVSATDVRRATDKIILGLAGVVDRE